MLFRSAQETLKQLYTPSEEAINKLGKVSFTGKKKEKGGTYYSRYGGITCAVRLIVVSPVYLVPLSPPLLPVRPLCFFEDERHMPAREERPSAPHEREWSTLSRARLLNHPNPTDSEVPRHRTFII